MFGPFPVYLSLNLLKERVILLIFFQTCKYYFVVPLPQQPPLSPKTPASTPFTLHPAVLEIIQFGSPIQI